MVISKLLLIEFDDRENAGDSFDKKLNRRGALLLIDDGVGISKSLPSLSLRFSTSLLALEACVDELFGVVDDNGRQSLLDHLRGPPLRPLMRLADQLGIVHVLSGLVQEKVVGATDPLRIQRLAQVALREGAGA